VKVKINETRIEQVKRFKYYGRTMSDDGSCETEIKCRIAQAKLAFSNRTNLTNKMLGERD